MEQQPDKGKDNDKLFRNSSTKSLVITSIICVVLIIFGIFFMNRGGDMRTALFLIGAPLALIAYEIFRVVESKKKKLKETEEDKQQGE